MANCYFAEPHGMKHCYIPFFMLLISNALLVLARQWAPFPPPWPTTSLANSLANYPSRGQKTSDGGFHLEPCFRYGSLPLPFGQS
jgi:hypothetical protein